MLTGSPVRSRELPCPSAVRGPGRDPRSLPLRPPLSTVELPQCHDHPQGGGRPGSRLHRRGETRRRHALLSPGPGRGEPWQRGAWPRTRGCWPGREKPWEASTSPASHAGGCCFNLPDAALSQRLSSKTKRWRGDFRHLAVARVSNCPKSDVCPSFLLSRQSL